MAKKLTQEQINAYERDGYLSPITVFSEEEAARYRKLLEEAEAKYPEAMAGANRNNAHCNFTFLDEITHHPALLDAVEDIVGPDVVCCATVLFIKEANDPGYVSWHQDGKYMGLEPCNGVTAWVALSESNEISGCMQVIPGSHKEGMRDHNDTYADENILTRGQEAQGVDASKAVAMPLKPGQVSFHHQSVVHASQPNQSNDRRIGFAIQTYFSPEVKQTKGTTFVQLARGEDNYGHFETAPRPTQDMQPNDVAMRDNMNKLWADILYHGTEKRRDY